MTEQLNDQNESTKDKKGKSLVGNWMTYGFIAGLLIFAVTEKIVWVGIGMCLGILLAAVKELWNKK